MQDIASPERASIKRARKARSRAHRGVEPYPFRREAIELAVAQVFGVTRCDLGLETRGPKRTALARQVAMYLTHVTCWLNLKETGELYQRDRTTVAHACELIEDRRDEPVFDRTLQLLEWIVRALHLRRTGAVHFHPRT